MKQINLLFASAVLVLAGCASNKNIDTQATAAQQANLPKEVQQEIPDPLEGVNRAIWDFNYEILDKYLVRPVAVGYKIIMPEFARTGLLNAAENLEEPSSAINNLLQGKGEGAAKSTGRFLVNSTIGLLGLIDVAGYMGLEDHNEEFGEVLGKWGLNTGPYLMLPAMGPTDARNFTGDIIDSAYFPLDDLTLWVKALRISIKAVEGRIRLMDQEKLLDDSLDPYLFVREAYFQRSLYDLYDGNVPKPQITEQEEEDFEAFLNDVN
ncbi:VacJ-like lipoprotein [Catenovulum agarivorans DS-2]|uniref:VacJ-like lipoprotein n=1 Tax=Catenovulum agarivorans DS-2 TaxID=1328313 RepID=W7QT60_9ALTE|nr:VacJ family lipoprotein [Catenovulum agarivorans]EWH12217.1 VacJ-like lipoprotein [Catenovulum agarivorans DS-2]